MIYEFNKRGGRVAYGTDDNYIWATPGFSNIRELQLLRETGMHTLEVLNSATLNSAKTLRQEKLGLVRPGYIADLMIVILDWGCTDPPGPCSGDVNTDGICSTGDLILIVLAWGPVRP